MVQGVDFSYCMLLVCVFDEIKRVLSNFICNLQGPKAEDRAQVVSKEVRLPNSAPTILDNQDAQIVRLLFCYLLLVGII